MKRSGGRVGRLRQVFRALAFDVLVNGVAAEVRTSPNLSDFRTNQE